MARQDVIAFSVEEADRLLNAAVEELQHLARQQNGPGILVTKTGPGQFTVELSQTVPYGLTIEALAEPAHGCTASAN
ncbi:hypothetical protein LVY72_08580 [Arthrobacter sp. I2-34]|uniref:Uncharacterized protein n=1 Tax=Arthrobacter hankyongi TaxID=2904801 RepID=A0ABS9L5M0_9MICC|nr:hypothetical protein [Arthrobacter hankyongi]MCG2621971.1 hypothetical protein [Arthrobacter hankyongi]